MGRIVRQKKPRPLQLLAAAIVTVLGILVLLLLCLLALLAHTAVAFDPSSQFDFFAPDSDEDDDVPLVRKQVKPRPLVGGSTSCSCMVPVVVSCMVCH